ncbi:MAG TPA: hypothetical protein VMZ90_15230 [Vicinamibacterales bacterium]|nr:hypothetical protein [Vicinamibacterales bacterium]
MNRFQRVIGGLVVAFGTWATLTAQQAAPAAAPQAQAATVETAAQYQGAAAEDFLKKAKIVRVRPIGTGVTLPEKVTLQLDGVERFGAFKSIDEKRPGITQFGTGAPEANFQDSWQLEIPAYVVDMTIGLGMVPATIERRVNNKIGSLQWWVTSMVPEAERAKQKLEPPDREAWDREVLKMKLFDQLIYNVDRHANNILVTQDFHLRLIDHSRSFRSQKTLKNPELLTRFSKPLLEGLQRLTFEDLRRQTGKYLMDSQIRTLIQRRDAILALAAKLVAEKGEAAVIYP